MPHALPDLHRCTYLRWCCARRRPPQPTPSKLPPRLSPYAESTTALSEQVHSLVSVGGSQLQLAVAYARELFRQVPSEALASVCDEQYGDAPAGISKVEQPPTQFAIGPPRSNTGTGWVVVTERRRC